MYEVRLCRHDELELLKKFIATSWSPNHIFLSNQDILNFQHRSQNAYNFVVAYHKETKSFHGILGVISPNFYKDRAVTCNNDLWLAIWKVEKELAECKSIGMDLLNYVVSEFEPNSISAIGINKSVSNLYRLLGFQVKNMNHWFSANSTIKEKKLIVGVLPEEQLHKSSSGSVKILDNESISVMDDLLTSRTIKEDFAYIKERYLQHPIYKYEVIGIYDENDKVFALGVGRSVCAKGTNAFRLTELFIVGNIPQTSNQVFDIFLQQNGYEYVDFVEYGFDAELLASLGFIQCDEFLYVPHLFEPYVAEKQDILIAYKSDKPFQCTKGDSDLDRPNMTLNYD